MKHLFPRFLTNEAEYIGAQAEWDRIWESIAKMDREASGWRSGWFMLEGPKDGNPIFTAISEPQQKAVRVIQYEPTTHTVEFDFWIDTFGGSPIEPNSIRELVIACALSDESAQLASDLISSWVIGDIELFRESSASHTPAGVRGVRPAWRDRPMPDASSALKEAA